MMFTDHISLELEELTQSEIDRALSLLKRVGAHDVIQMLGLETSC